VASELERIARLRALYGAPPGDAAIGIGDDAAVLAPDLVLTVDAAVEDVHFRRAWIGRGASWGDFGRRAALAAISDLAAMGAQPRALLSSLIVPPDLDDRAFDAIALGIAEAARACGAPVIGGNLSRGDQVSITTTAVGRAGARVLRRDGARPGDRLWVSGCVGAAALGLAALEAGLGFDPAAAPFVRRFLRPEPRLDLGSRAAAAASAAIDVSDGLVRDLLHLCAASGVGAEIEAAAIPLAEGHDALARRLGRDPLAVALAGGEDYELLLAGPEHPVLRAVATPIGRVVAGPPGVTILDANGAAIALPSAGYDHFSTG
jgi:thiamine-monophosphate kinase